MPPNIFFDIEDLSSLTALQVAELTTALQVAELSKILEEKWGATAAAKSVLATMPGAALVEEQTEFDVILAVYGQNKINVMKEVRAITGLGLKEAKALVESAPKPVKEAVSKEEAEAIKKKLKEAGATVEIRPGQVKSHYKFLYPFYKDRLDQHTEEIKKKLKEAGAALESSHAQVKFIHPFDEAQLTRGLADTKTNQPNQDGNVDLNINERALLQVLPLLLSRTNRKLEALHNKINTLSQLEGGR